MLEYSSISELCRAAEQAGTTISQTALADQAEQLEQPADVLYQRMADSLGVMRDAVRAGMDPELRSTSGLTGGDAAKMARYAEQGGITGAFLNRAMARAIAVSEYNAAMGKVVAAPTAGASGVLPAVLLPIRKKYDFSEEKMVKALYVSAGFGQVIATRASIAGAEGGCQAEIGSASAMAAAALVSLLGGTPEQMAAACATALQNLLGLVCDPVAGLVEVPCVKRNVIGAVNALTAAELALAGVENVIPCDEVIDAMRAVGDVMPTALRETGGGGLAATPTGRRIAEELLGP